jgi:hypothetical protein
MQIRRGWFGLVVILGLLLTLLSGRFPAAVAATTDTAVLCGNTYDDVNGNGVWDTGEVGLGNWVVHLMDAAGSVPQTAVTDATGRYCFRDLRPGSYVVGEVLQNGYAQTAPTSRTWDVTVAAGDILERLHFGNQKTPCCLRFRMPAGVADEFSTANGAEPASPSPGLLKAIVNTNVTGFDDPSLDKVMAHTYILPQGNCIKRATLTVRVKPTQGPLFGVENDLIQLAFTTATGAPVAGSHHYYGFFGSGNANPNPALLPNPWNANNYGATTFTFDLSNMPGNAMNLLADLQANRFLDVVVADDTSVDYMELLVEFCQC